MIFSFRFCFSDDLVLFESDYEVTYYFCSFLYISIIAGKGLSELYEM